MKEEMRALLSALVDAARGEQAARHRDVATELVTPAVLERLDSAEDYANAAQFRLRVSQVVDALAKNPAASARDAFLSVAENATFNEHEERTLALVRASVHLRPAPSRLVAFWDRHCQPEDGFTPTTITVLVDNGSQPALELFARKMEDPAHADDDKIAWMRTRVLPHRNDAALLQVCERLLVGAMPEPLLSLLVDVLFDYRPEDWFRPTTDVTVPALDAATPEALDAVIKVAIVALTMVALTAEQRLIVKERMGDAERLRARWPR
jgi:hypothetical protein